MVIRNVYKTVCSRSGLEVFEACNGLEAVKACDEENFDVILMDIAMPKMDGIEAIRLIKQKNPYAPIVISTGFLAERHQEAYNAGALKILTKPVSVRELIATIKQVLLNNEKNHQEEAN